MVLIYKKKLRIVITDILQSKNYILQTLKKFFHRLLKIGTGKDKDDVVNEIKEYHKQDLYDNFDLHDIANNTSKENEINDYLFIQEYDYDGIIVTYIFIMQGINRRRIILLFI